jgi:hypothetical protein
MSEPMAEDRKRRVGELRRKLFSGITGAEAFDIAMDALRMVEEADNETLELAKLRQHYPRHELAMNMVSGQITKQLLLTASEILERSASYDAPSGVYFLISGDEIVYVGQSINVMSRMEDHARRIKFKRFAFAPFPREQLDLVESLYIHLLRPRFNGVDELNGVRLTKAPHPLQRLLDMANAADESFPQRAGQRGENASEFPQRTPT